MIRNLLRKIGVDLERKCLCRKCKKEISAEAKRCPHCNEWNDCCSPDPLKMAEARKRVAERKKFK